MNTHPSQEAVKKEIIGWMNYGIPRGKTIPIFEDLLETYAQTIREDVLKEALILISKGNDAQWALNHLRTHHLLTPTTNYTGE